MNGFAFVYLNRYLPVAAIEQFVTIWRNEMTTLDKIIASILVFVAPVFEVLSIFTVNTGELTSDLVYSFIAILGTLLGAFLQIRQARRKYAAIQVLKVVVSRSEGTTVMRTARASALRFLGDTDDSEAVDYVS